MAYDLDRVLERVREYLTIRHPALDFTDPDSLSILRCSPDDNGNEWMFYIRYIGNRDVDLDEEFDRYRVDTLSSDGELWQGRGGSYIDISATDRPLIIGDGDDGGAVTAIDDMVLIWLRNL